MKKTELPTTFGIFKPVGHTLIAFNTHEQLQSAVAKLASMGFADSSMVRYSSAEMAAQVEAELLFVNPLATFGYELDLIRVHGQLAQNGCSFLIVEAPTDVLSAQVAELVRTIKPVSAQHYGRLMIEDLTEEAPGRMGEEKAAV